MPAVSGSAPPRAARAPRGHTTHGTVASGTLCCDGGSACPAASTEAPPLCLLAAVELADRPAELAHNPPSLLPAAELADRPAQMCAQMPTNARRQREGQVAQEADDKSGDQGGCGGGGDQVGLELALRRRGKRAGWRHAAGGDWTALHWTGAAGLPQRGAGAAFLQLRNPAGAPNSPSVTGSESGHAPTSAAARLLIPTNPLPPGPPAPASQSQNPPTRPHSTRTHS